MVLIFLSGFGDIVELHTGPCFICGNQLVWNSTNRLRPFLTIFGTGMRADYSRSIRLMTKKVVSKSALAIMTKQQTQVKCVELLIYGRPPVS
jgi:hypothetical protein